LRWIRFATVFRTANRPFAHGVFDLTPAQTDVG
jgi:hypothetical protein